jgi:hypothetical protein
MPSGLIHEQHGMGFGGDGLRDFGKVQVHRIGVAKGQDQPGAFAFRRADRSENVGRGRPLIMWRRGARTPLSPAARDLVLLADPGLVPRLREGRLWNQISIAVPRASRIRTFASSAAKPPF